MSLRTIMSGSGRRRFSSDSHREAKGRAIRRSGSSKAPSLRRKRSVRITYSRKRQDKSQQEKSPRQEKAQPQEKYQEKGQSQDKSQPQEKKALREDKGQFQDK